MAISDPGQAKSAVKLRRGSAAIPVVVSAGLFAFVLGTAFYCSVGSNAAADQLGPARIRTAQKPTTPARQSQHAQIILTADTTPVRDVSPFDAQLAAGKLDEALATALAVQDADQRTDMLKKIVGAHIAKKDFDAAVTVLNRIPSESRRKAARRVVQKARSLAGGGSANPQELVDFIKKNTGGQWADDDGVGGTVDPSPNFNTGVRVDAHGTLVRVGKAEMQGRLQSLGIRARNADLNDDMAKSTSLRLVSLTRLEREVAKKLTAGQQVPESMQHLAGISQIEYVFFYPELKEVVIGGPAEAWHYDEFGRSVGVQEGRPTLQLDDLVTVMRTFSPEGSGYFECLIVPRQDGLQKVKEFVEQSNNSGPLHPGQVKRWTLKLQDLLGLQDIVVNGVPLDSRVARVIVEADFRMKLIGVGQLDGGPQIPGYFDLMTSTKNKPQSTLDALRWWMTMKYQSVLHSPARDVFQVVGSSVLCQSENELVNSKGERIHTGQSEPANLQFASNFTNYYAELAKRDLVFADFQNILDLSLVAAMLRQERVDEQINWNRGVFASNGGYKTAKYEPAHTVMSVVNHRVFNGKDIVVQVAGGVRADLMTVVQNDKIVREAGRLKTVSPRGKPQAGNNRWWWDAAQ